MRSRDLHKVCFPIAGEPAIARAVRTYSECGVGHHVVVVGSLAEQVMRAVAATHANVSFAYQEEQVGTADAARRGLQVVPERADPQDILVVAGDKVIEPQLLRQLFAVFYSERCDLAFVTGDKDHAAGLGRIVSDGGGNVVANVESVDINQRRVLREIRTAAQVGNPPSTAEMREMMVAAVGTKAPIAFRCVWDSLGVEGTSAEDLLARIPVGLTSFAFETLEAKKITMTPDEVELTNQVNQSVYLLRADTLRFALDRLTRNNAQNEEYLSDIIGILAQQRRLDGRPFAVRAVPTTSPFAVMGFNNPEELLRIEDHIRGGSDPFRLANHLNLSWYLPISVWLDQLERALTVSNPIRTHLEELYTIDEEILDERVRAYIAVLSLAASLVGKEESVFIVRSPGRVNLLGRHVDHQGGHCNLMTVGREVLMVVRPRNDDQICLWNHDGERFPDNRFSIGEIVGKLPWDDWLTVVNSDAVKQIVNTASGDWSRYAMAAAVRLQKAYPHVRLQGADVVVSGNIPVAAGLSSSSALVVGTLESLISVNDLAVVPTQLVDLAGEGEWFVGTRGGSADHAAIKLGQKGKVVSVSFFDFAIEGTHSFPADYVLGVCNSGVFAKKSDGAKDQFNHRIACYHIGLALIVRRFPQYAPLLSHLRDVTTRNLRVPLSVVYEIVLQLPQQVTRSELESLLEERDLRIHFSTHAEPADGSYPIRGVVLYGLAECERSRLYAELLETEQIDRIGVLMRASHDGDRVATLTASGVMVSHSSPTSDEYLRSLIEDSQSDDPERVQRSQLELQPGSYRCSISQIDRMVDLALATPGVKGAQLAGAGLGGCMMALVERRLANELESHLIKGYYGPAGLTPEIHWCKPVAGSGVLLKP